MGLFSKKKDNALEQELLQRMQNSDLLNHFVNKLISASDAHWVRAGKPGDYNRRNVIVKPSGFIIEKPGAYERKDKTGYFAFNFSDCGYGELEAHRDEKGKVDIASPRMCYLYATAIQNRLRAVLTDCTFSPVSNDRNLDEIGGSDLLFMAGLFLSDNGKYATFHYQVPIMKGNDLF